MGMIGSYIAVNEEKLNAILDGSENILEINEDECKILNIDKSWQAIQYLLCSDIADGEPPMGYVVPMTMSNAVDCDMEFGAFYLSANEIKEALTYLESLDDATIKSMYDFSAMVEDEVYPVMADEDADQFYGYIHSYLLEIKKFYKETVENNDSVIFYIW